MSATVEQKVNIANLDDEPLSFFTWATYKGATLPVLRNGYINISNEIWMLRGSDLEIGVGYLGRTIYALAAVYLITPIGVLYNLSMFAKYQIAAWVSAKDEKKGLEERAIKYANAFVHDFLVITFTSIGLTALFSVLSLPIANPVISAARFTTVGLITFLGLSRIVPPLTEFIKSPAGCIKYLPKKWDEHGLNFRLRVACQLKYSLWKESVKKTPLNDAEIKMMLNIFNQMHSWDHSQGNNVLNYLFKIYEFLKITDRIESDDFKKTVQFYLDNKERMNDAWKGLYRTNCEKYPNASNNFISEKTIKDFQPFLKKFDKDLEAAKSQTTPHASAAAC